MLGSDDAFAFSDKEPVSRMVAAFGREDAATSAPGPTSDPAGGITAAFRDPQGRVFRLVHGDWTLPPQPPGAQAGAQGCRPVRLAHINPTDVDAATRFFEAAMGFRMTDRSKLMSFVSTNAERHRGRPRDPVGAAVGRPR